MGGSHLVYAYIHRPILRGSWTSGEPVPTRRGSLPVCRAPETGTTEGVTDGARTPALEGLRGLAIAGVVLFHTAVMATRDASWLGHSSPAVALWPLFAGKLGVDVFFVLSGFLVVQSWQRAREKAHGTTSSAAFDFARKRGRRIIPPYWFSLLILVPWRTPQWLTSLHGWTNILTFAGVQQFVSPDLPHQLNAPSWSLTTELHFYLLVPLLAFAMSRKGWARVLITLIAVSVLWRIGTGGTGQTSEWIIGRADQFVAGMAAAHLVAEHRSGRRSEVLRWLADPGAGWVLALVGGAIAIALGGSQMLPHPLWFDATFHEVFGVIVAAFIVRLVCFGGYQVLANRALVTLGLVSYSLYLWHWPLLMEATTRLGTNVASITLALAASAVMTALSYRYFERPFIGTKKTPAPVPSTATIDRGRLVAAHR